MSLYTPEAFVCDDRKAVARLIGEHPFATLITACGDELAVTHLPLLLVPDREPYGTLIGHVARANPHWQHFAAGKTLAIFQGPHHYISPAWYADPAGAVPTWNYAVVHCTGHPRIISGDREIDALLDITVRRFEDHQAQPWTPQLTPETLGRLRQAIVAFRMPVLDARAKFKLSQNRAEGDQQRVAAALESSESQEARALASWMQSLHAAHRR